MELENQDQVCRLYRELLLSFLKNVEEQTEQLSMKVGGVLNNIREFEPGIQKLSHNH